MKTKIQTDGHKFLGNGKASRACQMSTLLIYVDLKNIDYLPYNIDILAVWLVDTKHNFEV